MSKIKIQHLKFSNLNAVALTNRETTSIIGGSSSVFVPDSGWTSITGNDSVFVPDSGWTSITGNNSVFLPNSGWNPILK